jgi:hypothetical protein
MLRTGTKISQGTKNPWGVQLTRAVLMDGEGQIGPRRRYLRADKSPRCRAVGLHGTGGLRTSEASRLQASVVLAEPHQPPPDPPDPLEPLEPLEPLDLPEPDDAFPSNEPDGVIAHHTPPERLTSLPVTMPADESPV